MLGCRERGRDGGRRRERREDMEGGGGERERLIEKGGREGVENWEGGSTESTRQRKFD